jgi:modulator of FtsH protease
LAHLPVTIRSLDGYSLADWGLAFTATAGAAAALTGLLFVALSINLRQIVSNPGLVARAIEVLIVLTAALILSTLLLMPHQPSGAAGIEILVIAVAVSAVVGWIQLRTDRKALGISGFAFASRVVGAHAGPAFLFVGAISLLAETGGGLYWVVPALLAMISVSIVGAWVMLVEILR